MVAAGLVVGAREAADLAAEGLAVGARARGAAARVVAEATDRGLVGVEMECQEEVAVEGCRERAAAVVTARAARAKVVAWRAVVAKVAD